MPEIRVDRTRGVRLILLTVLVLGLGGLAAELLLVSHFEHWTQRIPFVTVGVAAGSIAYQRIRRSIAGVRAVQFAMVLLAGSGIAGTFLHLNANMEFQREMDENVATTELIWRSLRTTAPPALAPGVMVQLALVGWAYTYSYSLKDRP